MTGHQLKERLETYFGFPLEFVRLSPTRGELQAINAEKPLASFLISNYTEDNGFKFCGLDTCGWELSGVRQTAPDTQWKELMAFNN